MQPDEYQEDSKDVGRGRSKYTDIEQEISAIFDDDISAYLQYIDNFRPQEPEVSTTDVGQPRKRVWKACDRCRLKKSKCDGATPCKRCVADNAICVYGPRKRKHHTEELKDRNYQRPRSTSPEAHVDNDWARSQSPAGSFYSDDGRVDTFDGTHSRRQSFDVNGSSTHHNAKLTGLKAELINDGEWTAEEVPPPLHPPRHIEDLRAGQDPGWQWGNASSPKDTGFGGNRLATVRPGDCKDNDFLLNQFRPPAPPSMINGSCATEIIYEESSSASETDLIPRLYPMDRNVTENSSEPRTGEDDFSNWLSNLNGINKNSEDLPREGPAATASKPNIHDSTGKPHAIPIYQYAHVPAATIRLLRVSPGHFDDPIVCALKPVPVDKIKGSILSFQALSYSWNNERLANREIALCDISNSTGKESDDGAPESIENQPESSVYLVRDNLIHALKRIRQPDKHLWLWVDALCIDQSDEADKSQQIPYMPDVYSNAWNVIVWLGDDEIHPGDVTRAVDLIPKLLNLRTLDSMLHADTTSHEDAKSWAAFGSLLQRPWFSRRWVIQEVACARKLSVRIQDHVLSWLDFTDAVDVYLHNTYRAQQLYDQSRLHWDQPSVLSGLQCSHAMALLELTRSVFRESQAVKGKSKLWSLETLVLRASSFGVSEIRDTLYALLYLANDVTDASGEHFQRHPRNIAFTSDYSKHPVYLFTSFVWYSLNRSKSLDIICRPWATWPNSTREELYQERSLPSWVGVASFGTQGPLERLKHAEVLLGSHEHAFYHASRGIPAKASLLNLDSKIALHVKGIIIGQISCSSTAMIAGKLQAEALQNLGWYGNLSVFADNLWRTLVANRKPDGKAAPAWYRRACAFALTKLDEAGNLDLRELIASKTLPSAVIDYLRRVKDVADGRTAFSCFTAPHTYGRVVGLSPGDVEANDLVCILFGCSVPVIVREDRFHRRPFLRHRPRIVTLVGPCYVHSHMEGETFAGLTQMEIIDMTTEFDII